MYLNLFHGPQGAGKDTQAKLLEQDGISKSFSVGQILRDIARTNSKIQLYLDTGTLVPNNELAEILLKYFEPIIGDLHVPHLILTGFPRSVSQIQVLDVLLKHLDIQFGVVIYLKLDRKTSLLRVQNRYICPKCHKIYNMITNPPRYDHKCDVDGTQLVQRSDDIDEGIINKRLDLFYHETMRVIDYFREFGCVVEVDASQPVASVYAVVKEYFVSKVSACNYKY